MPELRHVYRSRWHWYQTVSIPIALPAIAALQPQLLLVIVAPAALVGLAIGLVLLRCRVTVDKSSVTVTNPLRTRRVPRVEVSSVGVRRTAFGNWYADFRLHSGDSIRAVSLSRPAGFLVKPEGGLNRIVVSLHEQLGVEVESDDPRFPLPAA